MPITYENGEAVMKLGKGTAVADRLAKEVRKSGQALKQRGIETAITNSRLAIEQENYEPVIHVTPLRLNLNGRNPNGTKKVPRPPTPEEPETEPTNLMDKLERFLVPPQIRPEPQALINHARVVGLLAPGRPSVDNAEANPSGRPSIAGPEAGPGTGMAGAEGGRASVSTTDGAGSGDAKQIWPRVSDTTGASPCRMRTSQGEGAPAGEHLIAEPGLMPLESEGQREFPSSPSRKSHLLRTFPLRTPCIVDPAVDAGSGDLLYTAPDRHGPPPICLAGNAPRAEDSPRRQVHIAGS